MRESRNKKKSQKRTSQFNILLYNISSFIFLKKNLLGLSWCRIYRIDRNITKSFRFPELGRFRNRCFNRICTVQTNIWERWEKNQWNNFRFWLFIQKNRTYHLSAGIILSFFLPLIFKDININLGVVYAVYYGFLASSLIGYFINYKQTLLGADQRKLCSSRILSNSYANQNSNTNGSSLLFHELLYLDSNRISFLHTILHYS